MERSQPPRISGSAGVTLLELMLWVLLLTLAVQLLALPLRVHADSLVLRGVREELAALLHRARMEARVTGEARVLLEEGSDPVLLVPVPESPTHRDSSAYSPDPSGATAMHVRPTGIVGLLDRGVRLEIAGERGTAEIAYGPLGVATFSPATVVLRRGEAEAQLVISGYGRLRR